MHKYSVAIEQRIHQFDAQIIPDCDYMNKNEQTQTFFKK